MNQSEALKAIVVCFGSIAAGAIAVAIASMFFLRHKTEALKRARLAREHEADYNAAHLSH